jgi:thiol-disulfide isomerase/thioredoxin
MKQILGLVFVFITIANSAVGQTAKILRFSELEALISATSDKIQVVNFWATWCAPCVKEMPIFEKANNEITDIKVTLVSLDLDLDPDPEKVYNFLERKKLTSIVVLLDEKDSNSWIERVDKSWSGAIPATLILNTKTGKRQFLEHELKQGELEKLIEKIK